MIGRVDQVLWHQLPREEALELCARFATDAFGGVFVEDAVSGETYQSLATVPFGVLQEVFVYEDEGAYRSWEELGADPSNANKMVHLLCYGDGRVTVVVDDPKDRRMHELVEQLRAQLADADRKSVV